MSGSQNLRIMVWVSTVSVFLTVGFYILAVIPCLSQAETQRLAK